MGAPFQRVVWRRHSLSDMVPGIIPPCISVSKDSYPRFYSGVPLETSDGLACIPICIIILHYTFPWRSGRIRCFLKLPA